MVSNIKTKEYIINEDTQIYKKENKKYPISYNNLQCLGPCYQPNTQIVHPITLNYVTNKKYPFCPVYNEHIQENGEKSIIYIDQCGLPTEITDVSNQDTSNNLLSPHIDLTAEYFLKKYYNIFTFEKMLDWLNEKKYTTLKTRIRVVNSAWSAFGLDMDILDQRIIDFYLELIKKKWIYEIIKEINDYIYIDKNSKKISLAKYNTEKEDSQKFIVEKINFIIDKFIKRDEIYKFLIKYMKYRKDEWNNINNHVTQQYNDFIDYIKNKIIATLNDN